MIQQKLTITQLLYDHIFVRVPKGGDASVAFANLKQQSELSNIECSWGFAEELTTETDEYIYYPKSFSKKGMYNDPSQDVDTLTNIQLQLADLLKNNHHYTVVEHFVKDMADKPEVEIFMLIESFGSAIHTNKRVYNKGHMQMEENEFNSMQKDLGDMQMACLPFLKQFGLDVNKETLTEKLDEYNKWYKHWKEWMHSFDNDTWSKINDMICKSEPLPEEYLPKKKWNEQGLSSFKNNTYSRLI